MRYLGKTRQVQTTPTLDSHIRNKLSDHSSDRTHVEDVERNKITNLQKQKQKIDDKQKTINQKKFINSEGAKDQRQKNEARSNVVGMIQNADEALIKVQGLMKQSNLANQRAHDAIEMIKNRPTEIQDEQQIDNEITPTEVSQLINEAKLSDQIAQDANQQYNDLRKAM